MIFIQFLVIPPAPGERPDDLVTASYVARRFGCLTRTVYRDKYGTAGIKPVSRARPMLPVPRKRMSLVRRRN